MSSSNNVTTSTPAKATVPVSQRSETRDKAEAAAAPRPGTAAVTVWQAPHPTAAPQLWVIWNRSQADENGTETTTLVYVRSGATDPDLSQYQPVKDTQGNRIQSAFTPALTVFRGQMHLIVVKPDGHGTLAHYAYVEEADAWEYNAGWVVQPQTATSPSIAAFSKSDQDLLYLAFAIDTRVHVCTYTPSTTDGVKYGTWSAPALTRLLSNDAPALFTSPRRTGPELHMAVVNPTVHVSEQALGDSPAVWTVTSPQPGGTTKGGVGACNTTNEAFLAAPTADVENPILQYTVWTEDGNTWPAAWTSIEVPVAYGDVAAVSFHGMLYLFYIAAVDSDYILKYERIQLHG